LSGIGKYFEKFSGIFSQELKNVKQIRVINLIGFKISYYVISPRGDDPYLPIL